jgi:hypothetical protein
MGAFHLIDPRRLELDARCILGDSRRWCTVYRREAGGSEETVVGRFWGRVSKIGRQTTGLEKALAASNVTGTLWVLHVPPEGPAIQHDDEVRTDDSTRWRVLLNRSLPGGQIAVISKLE